jgi:hypothetical protein
MIACQCPHLAKLTPSQVEAILARPDEPLRVHAVENGVSLMAISRILRGLTWKLRTKAAAEVAGIDVKVTPL